MTTPEPVTFYREATIAYDAWIGPPGPSDHVEVDFDTAEVVAVSEEYVLDVNRLRVPYTKAEKKPDHHTTTLKLSEEERTALLLALDDAAEFRRMMLENHDDHSDQDRANIENRLGTLQLIGMRL